MPSVNPSFMKDLKSMDRKLDCIWNPDNKKFIITYERAMGGCVPIATLAGIENGEFRQPNQKDLEFIKSGDLSNDSIKNKLNKVASYMENVREEQKRKAKQEIKAMTKDSKIQLQQAAVRVAGGKGNSAFRRIAKD
jgi:hypothetical protein